MELPSRLIIPALGPLYRALAPVTVPLVQWRRVGRSLDALIGREL